MEALENFDQFSESFLFYIQGLKFEKKTREHLFYSRLIPEKTKRGLKAKLNLSIFCLVPIQYPSTAGHFIFP